MESHIIIIFLFLLLTNPIFSRASSSSNTNNFLECLRSQFESSVIYTRQNTSYSSIFQSQVRNLRLSSSTTNRPHVIITPTHESQIQASIHCSKRHDMQIRVRSGGHDYEGLSYVSRNPNFVIIDMANLRSISIDTDDNTAWVQVGATLGQLYYTISRVSRTLAFPAGVCPTVGVGGHMTGGGYGMISRKHGLAVDNIIDARIMNVNGEILDRESMGDDLFWAIRGGGGTSFGIVLAFKVRLVTVPEIVTVFNVTRTLDQNATQLVHKWQYIFNKVDENLQVRVYLRSVRSPRDGKRTIVALFVSLFQGRIEALLPLMQEKFPELGLVERDCTEMSWIESTLFIAEIRNEPLDVLLNRTAQVLPHFKAKSDYVTHPIPEHGLRGIWRFLNEETENQAELQFSPYGGILDTVSESETPFPHRSGNLFIIHYLVLWDRATEAERHIDWIRRLYSYMARYVSKSPRAAYFNYRDLDLGTNNDRNTSYKQASIWGFKYFKNNFDRLVRVKTMVDPSNFFRNEQSIPPYHHDI